jgi:PKD repeat protein
LSVAFSSAGSFDPEGTVLTYIWTFGDGATSTTANTNHTYQTSAIYAAHLAVSDGTNTTSSTSLSINVTVAGSNYPPVAVASAAVKTGVAPLSVAFSSAGSSDPEGTVLTYNWAFGDGATSTAANMSHTYHTSGVYTAQLTVSDGTNTSPPSVVTITAGNGAGGMVAAYAFEEGSGGTVTDASGNGNNGINSGATWTTGKLGKALSFGTSSVITISDSASLDLTTGMTLEAWVYPTALNGVTDIIYKDPSSYFLVGSTAQGSGPALGGTFAPATLYGPASLPLNTWSYLAGTYNGATMQLYVNGLLVASQAQTGPISASSGMLMIGGNALVSAKNWAGSIDEVRIYNRALSQNEILVDMNTPVVGTVARPSPPGAPVVQ